MDHQPGPRLPPKKRRCDRLIAWAAAHPDWVLGFEDESRLARPTLSTWTEQDQPLRLVEQTVAKDDPDPKALACYGLLLTDLNRVWLRFVQGRPRSAMTTQYLAWCCQRLAAEGKTALIVIWDNASWHLSQQVRTWTLQHNRQVKQNGRGVRLVVCTLPVKSPWLNPIEPHRVQGNRKVVEPDRLLSAQELAERVCGYFRCVHEPCLTMPEKVT